MDPKALVLLGMMGNRLNELDGMANGPVVYSIGDPNSVPKYNTATSLTPSSIMDDGSVVTIGNPLVVLSVSIPGGTSDGFLKADGSIDYTDYAVLGPDGIILPGQLPPNTVFATGTTNFLSKFISPSALGNSLIYDNGTFVGIGTTTPGSSLHIKSGTPYITLEDTAGVRKAYFGIDGFRAFIQPSSGMNIEFLSGTGGGATTMTLTNSGNVGIGTNIPRVRFVNSGAGNWNAPILGLGQVGSQALLSSDGLWGLYQGIASYGDVWNQVQRNDGDTTTYNYVLQPLGGNVIIGTSTNIPGYLLQVNGTLYANDMITSRVGVTTRRIIGQPDFLMQDRTTSLTRWALSKQRTETGSNNGSDFSLERYDDAGNKIIASIFIKRSNGVVATETRTIIGATVDQDNGVDMLQVNGSGLFIGNISAANKQNSMAIDGTGVKFPTVDAVNAQANNIARATIFTGFLDTTDTFRLSRVDDFTLGVSASVYGVAFSQRFKQSPYAPSDGIENIAAVNVPLSAIGLTGTGTAIKFVGYRGSDNAIVFSDTQFIQSPSVAQLGIVLVKYDAGVTSFIDADRTTVHNA
jgi:hypothetical protein